MRIGPVWNLHFDTLGFWMAAMNAISLVRTGEPASNGEVAKGCNVNLAFSIRDKVNVKELARPGVVISIHLTFDGPKFEVRYFWDGVAKEVYFYEWEIE